MNLPTLSNLFSSLCLFGGAAVICCRFLFPLFGFLLRVTVLRRRLLLLLLLDMSIDDVVRIDCHNLRICIGVMFHTKRNEAMLQHLQWVFRTFRIPQNVLRYDRRFGWYTRQCKAGTYLFSGFCNTIVSNRRKILRIYLPSWSTPPTERLGSKILRPFKSWASLLEPLLEEDI